MTKGGLAFGAVLIWWAVRSRDVRGLGSGETVALDNVTLFSERLMLVGRPDRIIKKGKFHIPEEWKSSKRMNHGHELQLGTYFLLMEEKYGERPPYGVVVLGDGTRVRVENTEQLRSEVLSIARLIRESRGRIEAEIPVNQPAWKCRVCGQRSNCRQAQV